MKKSKKAVSLILAAIMALSVFTVVPFTVNAAEDESDSTSSYIYFDLGSTGWQNTKTVYCHIWAVDGSGTWCSWQTKAERCTDIGDDIWSYDLSQTGNEISASDGTIYSVIFSTNTGMQTYNLLMNGACIGDTVYCTGEEIETPEDSEKTAIVAAWRENTDCGPEKRITSTGNIVGTSYADGVDDTTLLAAYAVSYYNDSAKLAYIPSLLEQLNVTLDDLYAGIESKLNKSVSEESMSAEYAESILAQIKSALEEDDSSDTPVEDDTDENEEPEYLYCGDYAYTVLEDGTAEIAFYIGNETEIVIPSTLDGYTVTSIGESAFDYYGVNNYIVSIEIPDTVTTICDEAFGYIYNLEEIILPESVKSIGVYAFVSCDKLTSVIIPDSVETVGERAFYNCESLTSVQIASSVTNIGDCAFGYHYYTDITGKYSITYDDFTIYGYTGTAAETYANDNEIAFVSLGTVETEPVIGDADGNGIINIADVTVVQKAAVHLVVLSDEETVLADADGDGRVSVLDATCIQKFVVGGYSDTGLTGQKVEG
ncbi:MAG: leucine-rich repeat protein [Clostridiales bacterium]|nr:leucine-rich repeat protein [Clostridiales bacterium]